MYIVHAIWWFDGEGLHSHVRCLWWINLGLLFQTLKVRTLPLLPLAIQGCLGSWYVCLLLCPTLKLFIIQKCNTVQDFFQHKKCSQIYPTFGYESILSIPWVLCIIGWWMEMYWLLDQHLEILTNNTYQVPMLIIWVVYWNLIEQNCLPVVY